MNNKLDRNREDAKTQSVRSSFRLRLRKPGAFAPLRWCFLLCFLLSCPALADGPVTYAPEHCEFSVTFPTEPYNSRRCDDEEQTRCYDLVSYTQVYAMTSTVNFRIICNPVSENLIDQYSPEIMTATLRAMTKNSVVKEFDSSFQENEDFKQAGLVGEGKVGRTSTIYLAQLWIGKKSALSVEAELIGDVHPDSDKTFSDVLKSIHFVKEKEKADKAEEQDKTEHLNKAD